MPRGPRPFTQQDVTSALKGAVKAGIEVQRIEIDRDGKIVVVAGKPSIAIVTDEMENPWDQAEAELRRRVPQ